MCGVHAAYINKRSSKMGYFYIENEDLKREFEALPTEVKNLIMESGIEIRSSEQLRMTAERLQNLSAE